MAWETTIVVRSERALDEDTVRRAIEDHFEADVQEYTEEEV